jgi:hypothetical protein
VRAKSAAVNRAIEGLKFAIKAEVADPSAETFAFSAQKTMYGGKHIGKGERSSSSRARTKAARVSSRAASSRRPKRSQRKAESRGKRRA